jgi:hypothetical protein
MRFMNIERRERSAWRWLIAVLMLVAFAWLLNGLGGATSEESSGEVAPSRDTTAATSPGRIP